MKDRADKLLLTGAVLSLVIYLLNLWALRIPLPRWLYWLSVFQMLLAAGFHGVPAFCIQRFLLRTPGRRPLAALPPLLLLGWLLFIAALVAVLIAVSLRYALSPYLLADRPDDGSSLPIYRSVSLMRGWKWELFKLEFSFIGWEAVNFLLTLAVLLFSLNQAGLLPMDMMTDAWRSQAMEVLYSTPVVILSTLVTVPVSLWLIPYKATACAGFYDARLVASQGTLPEMPPL